MKRLMGFDNPRLMQAFIDYMAARQIELTMSVDNEEGFALWLSDESHLSEVENELSSFLADPNDPKYQAASWEVADSRTASFHYRNPSLLGMIKAQAGPFTLIIMIVCIVIYGLWILGLQQPLFSLLHFPLMDSERWQIWRYFTHALLHFSLLHIVFNCLWWWLLGGMIERQASTTKLVQLFLFSALISGFAQFAFAGPEFGGLSGVVYALLGYLWWMGWLAPDKGLHIPRSYVVFMLVWLIIGFLTPMNIANMAHLFGLLTGCGIALLEAKWPRHSVKS